MTKQDEYLTIKEAANFARKSEQTIRRAIKKGDLKAIKASGKYQVLITDLAIFYKLDLDKMSTQPTQPTIQMNNHQGEIDVLRELISTIKGELAQKDEQLRAKDEQLRAKDEQIAKLMQSQQAQQMLTMELTKRLPAITPKEEPSPGPIESPSPKPKGLWSRLRDRLR